MENITKLAFLVFIVFLIVLAYQLPVIYRDYGKYLFFGVRVETVTTNNSVAEGTVMEKTVPNHPSWKYVLFLPSKFNASNSYPMIIGLHGAGGRAMDYVELWRTEANKYGFIVACPQSNDSEGWWFDMANDITLAIINEMRRNYSITDVFLTGHSAGAKITYGLALWNPSTFRGIAPVSSSFGTYRPDESELRNADWQNFYILHGRNDNIIPLSNAQFAADTLRQYGANVTFRVLENHGHEYPTEENENIAKWFLSLAGNG